MAGTLLALIIVGGTFVLTSVVLNIFLSINYLFAIILSSVMVYIGISVKDMKVSAMRIYNALLNSDIEKARIETAKIVGRDTKDLSESELIRATVESIAEGITDGVISPIFYACISVPLMMAYKSISTLDSMVGYKNSKYINFGWASAKLDDIANFIPARIAGFLAIPIASFICKKMLLILLKSY